MSTPEPTPTHLPWATLCQSQPLTLFRSRLYPPAGDLGFGLRSNSRRCQRRPILKVKLCSLFEPRSAAFTICRKFGRITYIVPVYTPCCLITSSRRFFPKRPKRSQLFLPKFTYLAGIHCFPFSFFKNVKTEDSSFHFLWSAFRGFIIRPTFFSPRGQTFLAEPAEKYCEDLKTYKPVKIA
jgi:hypothetical protein